MKNFGAYIRELRESRQLLLRELAAKVAMDTALLSKIERGRRKATRKQVTAFAKTFNVEEKELEKQWLADHIVQLLLEQENPDKILKVAAQKIKTTKIS